MRIHVVTAGQTLDTIAQQYGVTRERIITDNELPNPDKLLMGQSLAIRVPNVVHTAAEGETLTQIATNYGTTVTQIYQNNLRVAVFSAGG